MAHPQAPLVHAPWPEQSLSAEQSLSPHASPEKPSSHKHSPSLHLPLLLPPHATILPSVLLLLGHSWKCLGFSLCAAAAEGTPLLTDMTTSTSCSAVPRPITRRCPGLTSSPRVVPFSSTGGVIGTLEAPAGSSLTSGISRGSWLAVMTGTKACPPSMTTGSSVPSTVAVRWAVGSAGTTLLE